jgi:hypothetical protein
MVKWSSVEITGFNQHGKLNKTCKKLLLKSEIIDNI